MLPNSNEDFRAKILISSALDLMWAAHWHVSELGGSVIDNSTDNIYDLSFSSSYMCKKQLGAVLNYPLRNGKSRYVANHI